MKEYESRSVLRRLPVDHIEEIEEESHVGPSPRASGSGSSPRSASAAWQTWVRFLAWLVIGLVI
jgi:hypothetical protein